MNSLYEVSKVISSKNELRAINLFDEFENKFLIPLLDSTFDPENMCQVYSYWKKNEWLRDWLKKFVNTESQYIIYLGNVKNIEDGIFQIGDEVDRPVYNEDDENPCASIWYKTREMANHYAAHHVSEDLKDKFGYVIGNNVSNDDIIVDYKKFYRMIKKWYNKNKNVKERWDKKFNENFLQNIYKKL